MTDTMITVFDTETTGMGEDDEVCEVGYVVLMVRDRVVTPVAQWSSLVRPTRVGVSHEARAAHHIMDEELAEAPTMRELVEQGDLRPLTNGTPVIAHNLEFDERLLRQSGVQISPRRICTYRTALHVLPEAGHYGNQFLRYYLEVNPRPLPRDQVLPPHRALPDALVTEAVATWMLERHGLEHIEALQGRPALLVTCNIGDWRGRPWREVDSGMLRWILKKDFGPDVKHTCMHWLREREKKVGR